MASLTKVYSRHSIPVSATVCCDVSAVMCVRLCESGETRTSIVVIMDSNCLAKVMAMCTISNEAFLCLCVRVSVRVHVRVSLCVCVNSPCIS